MKRAILALSLVLALVATASAELRYTKVSATTAAGTITVNAPTLLVINDGSGSIYVRVFWEGETPADATASSTEIKSGESMTFNKTTAVAAISIVSASTSTVRLVYW